ncbi:ribosome recycling factor [Curtanaerobium respiraculi]|jgi:ribosome recycling factor|uniref:ribosome recycling factor n=1 Tax=Curtanaerobium respiraculi TaxID=2949669 RepID=UPI0024B336DA|nr:ribosome recycling factor [Curtanaerobium respiraculi]
MVDVEEIKLEAEDRMEKALDSLGEAFASVRTGRANAMVLDRIRVEYYGVPTPINQMAAIKTPDAHMLVIEPWDKGTLGAIEHAIHNSNLGINPNNDGTCIRLSFPQLTEERRRDLVRDCKTYSEEARIAIRNARRDANTALEKAGKNDNLPEDQQRRAQDDIQKLTDSYIAKVEDSFKEKEKEVMAI